MLSARSLRRDCYMPTVHCNKSRDSIDVLKKLCYRRKLRHLRWLSGGRRGILSELLRALLCATVVHNGMHTNMSSSEIYA